MATLVNQAPPPVTPKKVYTPFSTADMMMGRQREYILLAGKDGAGKSSAIVSLAWFVQNAIDPNATFYVLDSEFKFQTAVRSFGADAPTNLVVYEVKSMNEIVEITDHIMSVRKPWDWFAAESLGRYWEYAQDMGYMAVSGYDKSSYLEIRRAQAKGAKSDVIPHVDQFWSIVKGAHDAGFLDLLTQASTLNVVLSTTMSKPPVEKPGTKIKENEVRKAQRIEFGLEAGLDGAPRLATYVETTIIFHLDGGKVSCQVVRDNPSKAAETRVTFDVPDKRSWAVSFWGTCRG